MQTTPEFDPFNPKLVSMTVDNVTVAMICQLLIIAVLVPLISKGVAGGMVKSLASLVSTKIKESHHMISDQVLSSALKDVLAACGAVQTLLSPATHDGEATVTELNNARKEGAAVCTAAGHQECSVLQRHACRS